jgi:hypothetical protein
MDKKGKGKEEAEETKILIERVGRVGLELW